MILSGRIKLSYRQKGHGNNLRAAILGLNDGLISNAGLILGIAGAQVANHYILLAGITGLLAGAFSMAAGEYVSVRSQRELLEYQIAQEKIDLAANPDNAAQRIATLYQSRGLPPETATMVAATLIKNPQQALETLARESLGLNLRGLVSPLAAAVYSLISFATGALIPLLPFIVLGAHATLLQSILLSVLTLFSVGAVLSLFTGQNPWKNGLRMLLLGGIAGVVTYWAGSFFHRAA